MSDYVISSKQITALSLELPNEIVKDLITRPLLEELKKEREKCIKILGGKFLKEIYPHGIPKFVDTEHDSTIPSIGIDVLSEIMESLRSEQP